MKGEFNSRLKFTFKLMPCQKQILLCENRYVRDSIWCAFWRQMLLKRWGKKKHEEREDDAEYKQGQRTAVRCV